MLRYAELSMYTVIIQFVSLCCHGNGMNASCPYEFFVKGILGSSEQFETHEELSWGAR